MAKYKILKARSRKELEPQVEKMMEEGYDLGQFAVGFYPNFVAPSGVKSGQEVYYQTMISIQAEEPQDMGSDG